MRRKVELSVGLLLFISCGLSRELNADFVSCPSHPIAVDKLCICQRTDPEGGLLVNCSGHSGPLSREDLLCCQHENSTSSSEILDGINPDDVEVIYLADSNLGELDFRIFANFSSVQTLNASRSGIVNVTWDNCSLPALKHLDLSRNNMTYLSRDFFMCNRSFSVLDLSETPWNCELFKWFVDWVRKPERLSMEIPRKSNTLCYYYSTTNVRSAYLWDMIESCPKNCSCILQRLDIMKVDCNGQSYYDFPEQVPYNTRVLHMENNAIHSFQRIKNLTCYQNLTTLHLDNNAIESVKELEGIQRHLRLATLHLAGNRITHLSGYIMEQLEADSITLGGNPWHCDCKQGTSLLNYVTNSHHRKIQDIGNITCASTDSKHANKVVHRLTETDMCYSKSDKIHPLDIVNVILALLIVIVLVKLGYDWWQFKHKGNLPAGPMYIAQLWKQRGARLNRAKLDCTKSLLTQKQPSSPNV